MFGSEDQNHSSGGQTATPASGPISGSPDADVVATAPIAPAIPDPMVTPTVASPTPTIPTEITQPESGINGVSMENANLGSTPQISTFKTTEPDSAMLAASATSAPPVSTPAQGDLASIKLQALQSLEPLLDKLELPPEEKYKTIMMVIQASDKPKMLDEAYRAANQITDEKVRAQALLDIVNEVNYFSAQANK